MHHYLIHSISCFRHSVLSLTFFLLWGRGLYSVLYVFFKFNICLLVVSTVYSRLILHLCHEQMEFQKLVSRDTRRNLKKKKRRRIKNFKTHLPEIRLPAIYLFCKRNILIKKRLFEGHLLSHFCYLSGHSFCVYLYAQFKDTWSVCMPNSKTRVCLYAQFKHTWSVSITMGQHIRFQKLW